MKKTKKVYFYVQRHGEKEDGFQISITPVTKKGLFQVVAASELHLKGIEFDQVYSSYKFRAMQTAFYAMTAHRIDFDWRSVTALIGFDFENAPGMENFKEIAKEVARRMEAENRPATVGLWREVAPETVLFLSGRLFGEMSRLALDVCSYLDGVDECTKRIWYRHEKEVYNIYAASHSPTAEAAADNPETPMLREADIIRYEIEVCQDGDKWSTAITEVKYLPRPE